MAAIVVDASVAVKWLIEEEQSDEALALRAYGLTAPDLILTECVNAFWALTRRGLEPEQVPRLLRDLRSAPITLTETHLLLERAVDLALTLDHPVYDCVYLALAFRASRPFVTADRRLVDACRRHGNLPGQVVFLGEPIPSQKPRRSAQKNDDIERKQETKMQEESHPFSLEFQLDGWNLFIAHLQIDRDAPDDLTALRTEVAQRARERYADNKALAADPTVAALRKLFKAAGCDPSRYRPSSEALLRRLVKGDELPAINPLVDLNNCLSAELAVPCCVMSEGSFGTRLTLRAGEPGENYISLRGPFKLEGKPLIADENGAVDSPITGNEKVKVEAETRSAWLMAYLPAQEVSLDEARTTLSGLASRCGMSLSQAS